jgi:hypothetical protein
MAAIHMDGKGYGLIAQPGILIEFHEIANGIMNRGVRAISHHINIHEIGGGAINTGFKGQSFGCNKRILIQSTPSLSYI